MAPFLLRTLANRLTTLTRAENVGLSWGLSWGLSCDSCCWAPSKRRAGRKPRADSKPRREIDPSIAMLVLRDARDRGEVTCKAPRPSFARIGRLKPAPPCTRRT